MEQRATLHALALRYDQRPPVDGDNPMPAPPNNKGEDRPGDDFNRRATWSSILQPHGWRDVGSREAVTFWRRPGKREGVSATSNYKDSDCLYVFSSNAHPLDAETAYSKFGALVVLEYHGDFSAAASALARQGFGR
jgi:putative DNA primase/helicase